MPGVNKVILLGNLGRDPEMRHTPQGQPVCNFSIATSDDWTSKDGEKKERMEWHKIVTWGKLAELCDKYLRKGSQCFIEGKLQTRVKETDDGQKRYYTEVIAETVQFVGKVERTDQNHMVQSALDVFGAPPEF